METKYKTCFNEDMETISTDELNDLHQKGFCSRRHIYTKILLFTMQNSMKPA